MELLISASLVAAALVGVVAIFAWQRERRRAEAASNLAIVLAGHADASRTPFELLQQAAGGGVMELASGGDNHAGATDNMQSCPCRHTYTCATRTIVLNAWPNPKPNPVKGFPWNAPPRDPEPWPCPGNCVIVCTKVWRGWVVVQFPNGIIKMHIHTFAQYHCKEPTDPDRNKEPEGEKLPPEPKPERPPKPGEVIP